MTHTHHPNTTERPFGKGKIAIALIMLGIIGIFYTGARALRSSFSGSILFHTSTLPADASVWQQSWRAFSRHRCEKEPSASD